MSGCQALTPPPAPPLAGGGRSGGRYSSGIGQQENQSVSGGGSSAAWLGLARDPYMNTLTKPTMPPPPIKTLGTAWPTYAQKQPPKIATMPMASPARSPQPLSLASVASRLFSRECRCSCSFSAMQSILSALPGMISSYGMGALYHDSACAARKRRL